MFTTYDLLSDVNEMRSLMNDLFNDRPYIRIMDYPYVNLYEKDDLFEIAVIAPGVGREDINLELLDNDLIIEAEKKSDYEEKQYIRKERDFGKFRKTVELPAKVDPNRIEASMKDGVLTVKLFKAEEAKAKKIEIH